MRFKARTSVAALTFLASITIGYNLPLDEGLAQFRVVRDRFRTAVWDNIAVINEQEVTNFLEYRGAKELLSTTLCKV